MPERAFFDIFAGTGAVGMEAISRGAKSTTFVERDFSFASQIDRNLKDFHIADRGRVMRADVYRWAERWQPFESEPVNVFLSPPFADLTHRLDQFLSLVATLRKKSRPVRPSPSKPNSASRMNSCPATAGIEEHTEETCC